MSIAITHAAIGSARVAQGRVSLTDSGDTLLVAIMTRFGQRVQVNLEGNQVDETTLRRTVEYLDRIAREQPGDPMSLVMPVPPRTYLPNTTWRASTVAAFSGDRHAVLPVLVTPLLEAKFEVSAFAGIALRSRVYADKQGLVAAGEESDTELTVTGWSTDGTQGMPGSGWAGQAAREWTQLDAAHVGREALRLTRLAAHPVALEPGRRTVILGRPAVAQLVRFMSDAFDAQATMLGVTPLYNPVTRKPKLGERVTDPRLTLSSHPNDPDGGILPFDDQAYPIVPRVWIEDGVLKNLAWRVDFAAAMGVTPASNPPESLRLVATPGTRLQTIDEMIAACENGVYVNRLSHLEMLDGRSGLLTGVTSGGCFLVRDGRIEKSVKNLRFHASPWFFLNQLEAVGTSERTAFGYAPWQGPWPIPPTIVPPLMVRDFNFSALADNV